MWLLSAAASKKISSVLNTVAQSASIFQRHEDGHKNGLLNNTSFKGFFVPVELHMHLAIKGAGCIVTQFHTIKPNTFPKLSYTIFFPAKAAHPMWCWMYSITLLGFLSKAFLPACNSSVACIPPQGLVLNTHLGVIKKCHLCISIQSIVYIDYTSIVLD